MTEITSQTGYTIHRLLGAIPSMGTKEIQEEDQKAGTNRAQALVEQLAGKNRSNIVASILQNGDILE